MPMQTVALVNGHPDMLPWLDHLLEGNKYEVVFSTLDTDAYADIKRLRPQRTDNPQYSLAVSDLPGAIDDTTAHQFRA